MQKLVIGIFLTLLVASSANFVHAQSSGLSAKTDKKTYDPGDRVDIAGTVTNPIDQNPVTIIVRNPIGNVYEVGQVPFANNRFIHEFVLGDDVKGGNYTVEIRQDDETTQIQFQVLAGQTQVIPVFDSEIRASGKDADLIKYGNVEISTADNSITIQVNASKISNGTVVEEFHIPKRVINTTNGQLVVKENGIFLDCIQTSADMEWILDCPINTGTNEITLVGTSVIPEFGPSTAIVFGLAVSVSIAILTRNTTFSNLR